MKEELSLREIQLEETKILKEVAKFCDKHNLKYFLAYGTLLGAVRHKGFIPWDDDIDIALPRDDYNRFIELAKTNKVGQYIVEALSLNGGKYPFAKVINKEIHIKAKANIDKYLWIDVFPVDGLPDDYNESVKIYKKALFYKKIFYLHTNSFYDIWHERKSLRNRLIKVLLKPFSYLFTLNYLSKRIINISTKYDFNTSKYAGVIVWSYGIKDRFVKDEVYKDVILLDFEDSKISALKEYDKYLTQIYGDYMTPPKVKDRVTHHVKVWRTK